MIPPDAVVGTILDPDALRQTSNRGGICTHDHSVLTETSVMTLVRRTVKDWFHPSTSCYRVARLRCCAVNLNQIITRHAAKPFDDGSCSYHTKAQYNTAEYRCQQGHCVGNFRSVSSLFAARVTIPHEYLPRTPASGTTAIRKQDNTPLLVCSARQLVLCCPGVLVLSGQTPCPWRPYTYCPLLLSPHKCSCH
jgi:hypothetical protein